MASPAEKAARSKAPREDAVLSGGSANLWWEEPIHASPALAHVAGETSPQIPVLPRLMPSKTFLLQLCCLT